MLSDIFRCPLSKNALRYTVDGLLCESNGRVYEIVDGIPDFFLAEAEEHAIRADDKNRKWLEPQVAEARDWVYSSCTRQLKGMAFCMEEIAKRSFRGCRILEVGTGTGHFSRWLSEVCEEGTEIYTFDFSRPIMARALANTKGCAGLIFFRANARGPMPFENEMFDIIFQRLAPFGPRGVGATNAALEMLKSGGWYIFASWEQEFVPLEAWAESGYDNIEHHRWQYSYTNSDEEFLGQVIEGGDSLEKGRELLRREKGKPGNGDGIRTIKIEDMKMGQKPRV